MGLVGHLFSNVVNQEQGNTIVNYNRPLSSEALSPHGYNAHQEGHTFIILVYKKEMRRDEYDNHILIIHLFLHSIKHI
jgi:hypothetical protein